MYYIAYGFIRFLSFFPLPILYLFSDAIYGIIYYIAGYRRKVVMQNLVIAFPEKSEKERRRISKDFYHGLIDTFIETIKFFSWNYKNIDKRFTADLSGLDEAVRIGRPVHAIGMHNFNWEFVNWYVANNATVPFLGIYMPIGSKVFDRMMRKMRGKYATVLIPATDFKNHYQQWVKTPHILGSAADQSPATPTNAYWVDFFGRKTAFIRGAERGAVAINAAVVFVHFFKVKRGHYRMVTKFITDDAAKLDNGKFVQSYAHFVEEAIKMKPANYLWSHRRWKHEWKPEYQHLTL